MGKHVKIAGWLWIVNGVVTLLMGIGGLFIIRSNVPNPRDALIVTLGVVVFMIPGAIADVVAGRGLLKLKKWTRVLAIFLAVINVLFLFPLVFPLILGIYTLIIMFNQKTKPLFMG